MSLESFIGLDGGESMSESALEALKEKMKAAAAQIAAIKKEEGKQKKTENELLRILLKFVKTSHKQDLVLLISRVLEINIPANFILAIIILSNEDIREAVGGDYKMLQGASAPDPELLAGASHNSTSLVFFREQDDTLPLRIKIELDNWIKGLLFQAQEKPQKLLKTAYKVEIIKHAGPTEFDPPTLEEVKKIHPALVNLTTYIVRDYLEQNKINEEYEILKDFAAFILKGILTKTKEYVDGINFLEGDIAENI